MKILRKLITNNVSYLLIVKRVVVLTTLLQFSSAAFSQPVERDFVGVAAGYSVTPNITYHRAGAVELKLDVYRPRG